MIISFLRIFSVFGSPQNEGVGKAITVLNGLAYTALPLYRFVEDA